MRDVSTEMKEVIRKYMGNNAWNKDFLRDYANSILVKNDLSVILRLAVQAVFDEGVGHRSAS